MRFSGRFGALWIYADQKVTNRPPADVEDAFVDMAKALHPQCPQS